MRYDDLAGRTVAIWGAGREARAALEELTRRGITARLAVTGDGGVPEDLLAVTETGAAAQALLESADAVVKSPGVPHTSPEFLRLRALGVPVGNLTDLWLHEHHERVLAVTGTKGKSTTSSLAHHLLGAVGVRSALVGNGGTPVTTGDQSGLGALVAEVSSYQAADLTVSPRVAVVTSLYPEHLPWHGGYEQYVHDKLTLVAHGPESVVMPDHDGEVARLVRERAAGARLGPPADLGLAATADAVSWEGIGEVPAGAVALRGRHNLVNLTLALAAVDALLGPAADRPALLAGVTSYAPLAHRLETVPSGDGRTWIDDSLATAPEAVVAALETCTGPVTALVGGADRGLAMTPLTDYLAARDPDSPVHVLAVGPAGRRLVDEAPDGVAHLRVAPDFATALTWAAEGEPRTVLLSPGAPSFDEFRSYEERSAAFRAAALAAR